MREYSAPTLVFCYLFFALFVFTALSVLVSFFSSTFSQLFSLMIQNGRIFDIFLSILFLLGFLGNLGILILSSWNQKEGIYMRGLVILGLIGFVFLFVLNLSTMEESNPLQDLVLLSQEMRTLAELLLEYWVDVLVWGVMYVGFVLLPLVSLVFDSCFVASVFWRRVFEYFRPSLNVVIYALMGFAMQSYFHKNYWVEYVDLFCFLAGFVLLWVLYAKKRRLFGFYERINLSLLCVGVVVFVVTSKLFVGGVLLPRSCFYVCAVVAWCMEWGYAYAQKKK